MQQQPRPPFDQLEAPNGVCVADGWGLKIHVRHGHLIIEDGIGRSRRIRRYHKATADIDRLVILGHSGYETLEAARWLHDAKINTIHIDTDGTVLSATSHGINNPALRRAQALAATDKTGVEITRYLLGEKIRGQRNNARRLATEASDAIARELDGVDQAATLDQLRIHEQQVAVTYWQAWEGVEMVFVRNQRDRVPHHWRTFASRRSTQSASGRRAVTPTNAILNYLYALAEAEARIALVAVGLDPGLGILHLDKYARDSFALDLMEAVRPAVDAYVLDLLDGHHFRTQDFHETRAGGCVIGRPLAHILSETAVQWRNQLAEPAETIGRILTSNNGLGPGTTPLTQTNRRTVKGSEWKAGPIQATLAKNCQRCGTPVPDTGKLCLDCRATFQAESEWLSEGRSRLQELRTTGEDPAHGGKAAKLRGDKNRAHQIAVARWNSENQAPSPEQFTKEILPRLQDVSLKHLAEITGLSLDYCSKIRRGLRTPHPRHWGTLEKLAQSNK